MSLVLLCEQIRQTHPSRFHVFLFLTDLPVLFKLCRANHGRNISNLRYADDTTLMAESEEELKSLLMKVKDECEKVDLKLNLRKTRIVVSGPITSWQTDGEQWKQ